MDTATYDIDTLHPVTGRRPRRRRARLRRALLALALLALVVACTPRVMTWTIARGHVAHRPADIPTLADGEHRAAIVLGAGVVGEHPSPLLRDRIDGAVELFQADRVDLLMMSGDNSTEYYDEPTVMRHYAISRGIPDASVAADYAGRRTWDTCKRARDVFGIDTAIVVTNSFHVDRTVTTCRAAGVDATGFSVSDSHHSFTNRARWRARELAASGRALVDAWWLKPDPAVGGDRIDPWNPCELRESLAPSDAERSAAAFADLGC